MDAKMVANYLSKLKEKSGLTYEAIAERSGQSESTVKNLCTGKTENPGIATVRDVAYAMDGSLDAIYGKIKETSINEVYETHINNIRAHYEQHRQDSIENYEKRLADKREIIDEKNEHIKSLKKEIFYFKLFSAICLGILVGLLIAEVMNPNLGWLRF